jgi:hypothetical protein
MMTDTPPAIAEMVRTKLMARTGEERFIMGVQMFEVARRMVLASFPEGLTEAERRHRLFERIYGMPLRMTSERSLIGDTGRDRALL